jgi:hypothetical protein
MDLTTKSVDELNTLERKYLGLIKQAHYPHATFAEQAEAQLCANRARVRLSAITAERRERYR